MPDPAAVPACSPARDGLARAPAAFLAAAWRRAAHGIQAAADGSGRETLEVRLAETGKEIRRAQRLRYKVFYQERSWPAPAGARLSRRDRDAFDAVCDHMLVIDHAAERQPWRVPRPKVVGTYRLLRREAAERHGGFYSANEFDLAPMLAVLPGLPILELGRSCVHRSYRSRKVVDLLWQGVRDYADEHRVAAMIGCASLPGTDTGALATPLSYLHHHAAATGPWRVRARPERHVRMDLVAREDLDRRAAFRSLPPLLKGYLRLGATVGDGAVVDDEFGTTDVFVVLPVGAIRDSYQQRFGPLARACRAR